MSSQLSEALDKVLDLEKEVEEARAAARKQAASGASSEVALARAEAAESEASRLRDEVALREAEMRRMEETVRKQAADTEALMKATGSEREALMSSQLSEASSKVLELEKEVEEARALASASDKTGELQEENEKQRHKIAVLEGYIARLQEVQEALDNGGDVTEVL